MCKETELTPLNMLLALTKYYTSKAVYGIDALHNRTGYFWW
jgi:hypothetical protein